MSANREFVKMNLAVLTVSDSRNKDTDTSGQYLVEQVAALGHVVSTYEIVIDDIYLIRAQASVWIADPNIHAPR